MVYLLLMTVVVVSVCNCGVRSNPVESFMCDKDVCSNKSPEVDVVADVYISYVTKQNEDKPHVCRTGKKILTLLTNDFLSLKLSFILKQIGFYITHKIYIKFFL